MVQIYYEITIYIYKAIFPLGASPLNPRWGPACPQTPQSGGYPPQTPQRRYPPSALPHMEECTYFWGENTSWGINMTENKRPLNQEDNQAPQPTISHLETDLNNSTATIYDGLWTFLDLENFSSSSLEDQLKLIKNSVSPWLLPLLTCLQDSG